MKNLILFISDDGNTDRRLRLALARTAAPAFRVELVDGRAGIEALRPPILILLDLMLSKQPACDVLRWLRSDQRYRDLPVFVLGSEKATHHVNEAYALGANSCFLKDSAGEDLERIAEGIAAYAHLIPGIESCACG